MTRYPKKKVIGGKTEWCGTTKTRWQQPTGSSRRQLCRYLEARDYEVLNTLGTEKKTPGPRAAGKVQERQADLYETLESAATDEKEEERDRDKFGDRVKGKEEEDEATCLMEDMRKNVEATQHTKF